MSQLQLFSILDANGYVLYAEFHTSCPENGSPLLVTTKMRTPRIVDGVLIDENPYTQQELVDFDSETEHNSYMKRAVDGQNAYLRLAGKLRAMKKQGIISEEDHATIDDLIEPIGDAAFKGQWITAKKRLIALGDSVIGTDLYNELYTEIQNYIDENYV